MEICAVCYDRMGTSARLTPMSQRLIYFQNKTKVLAGSLMLTENKQAYVITAWHMLNPIEKLCHREEKVSEDSGLGPMFRSDLNIYSTSGSGK